ncbi:MAG: bifunctional non-ous end joining protein LigD [Acidimicrobiaceae bacterium]|jgi:bifunctional non-homologous end joining protein LigD
MSKTKKGSQRAKPRTTKPAAAVPTGAAPPTYQGPVPPVIAPMLTGSIGTPENHEGWLFEPKWDGVRAVARVWGGRVSISSRLGNDVTAGYPELAELGAALGDRAVVLDGEIITFDENGRPSFERLQRRMHVRRPAPALVADVPALFVVFDVLWLDGQYVTDEAFVDRRRRLEELALTGPSWQTSPLLPDAADDELVAACRNVGLEGYMGKQASSIYAIGKRSKAWTKVKCVGRREFVVGGWSEGGGGRSGQIGSLAIGWVDPDAPVPPGHPFALRYVGQVGSGLSDLLLQKLSAQFEELATETSPFANTPGAPLHYVRPTVVVEVMFNEVTVAGVLRQPSLKGLRDDVDPATVGWTDELA